MEHAKEKSPYNAGRRVRLLAAGIVLLIVAYTGGWYWLAGRIDGLVGQAILVQRDNGTDIDCADREMHGYPFRFELRCTALDVDRPGDGISVRAGGFHTAAQFYEPRRVLAELDGPVAVTGAVAGGLTFDWRLGRASAVLDEPLPRRASVVIDDLAVAIGGLEKAVAAAHAESHMRVNGPDLDLALRYDGLAIDRAIAGGRQLPVLAGDADLTIKDGVALAIRGAGSLRGVSGTFRRLALLVTPDRGVLISGPFEIGPDGLVDASLEVYFVDPQGLAETAATAFPESAPRIAMLAAVPPTGETDGIPEVKLPVTIRDGNVIVGVVPVGRIPPVR